MTNIMEADENSEKNTSDVNTCETALQFTEKHSEFSKNCQEIRINDLSYFFVDILNVFLKCFLSCSMPNVAGAFRWTFTALLLLKDDRFACGMEPCLLGAFTNVQSWVMDNGQLHPNLNESISMDLSSDPDKVYELRLMLIYTILSRNLIFKEGSAGYLNKENIDSQEYGDLDEMENMYPEMFNPIWEPPFTLEHLESVVFLSLALNNLDRIPLFYLNNNGTNTVHFRELRFLSFFGNSFSSTEIIERSSNDYIVMLNASDFTEVVNSDNYGSYTTGNPNWVGDLKNLNFPQLLELDLRNCSIRVLEDDTFASLPNLRRLYLSYNKIHHISENSFSGLSKLVHLDISFNRLSEEDDTSEGMTLGMNVFQPLVKLSSLDFSYTKMVQTCAKAFAQLGPRIERLSLCYTKFPFIGKGLFANTSMKHLDISGNFALDSIDDTAFAGIESTLEILFANRLGIHSIQFVKKLLELRVLSLNNNDITSVEGDAIRNLSKLVILDLNSNRISNWNEEVFSGLQSLELVGLASNNLNIMTTTMLKDFHAIDFMSISNNRFICNCYMKGFIAKVVVNGIKSLLNEKDLYPKWFSTSSEFNYTMYTLDNFTYTDVTEYISYQNAYYYYSWILEKRYRNFINFNDSEVYLELFNNSARDSEDEVADLADWLNFTTTVLDDVQSPYLCTDYKTDKASSYYDISDCDKLVETYVQTEKIQSITFLVVFLVIVAFLVTLGGLAFWKRWYIRYFYVMIKNAAVLSVMGKDSLINDSDKVFTYDVFVSYCDDDRPWVLEELIPEVENNTPVSVCLHERDFQVGLSILENIISCMDRSRTLMMVVSNQFLLSHWCQFEMHLAQHRLLETRREQLILVLLEDIPRRKRPNTLHYLMMTKTYIVWPKNQSDRGIFWKRLRKALVHGKTLATERTSTA